MLSATDQGMGPACLQSRRFPGRRQPVWLLAVVQWRSPRALLQASHPHGVHRFLESLAWRYPRLELHLICNNAWTPQASRSPGSYSARRNPPAASADHHRHAAARSAREAFRCVHVPRAACLRTFRRHRCIRPGMRCSLPSLVSYTGSTEATRPRRFRTVASIPTRGCCRSRLLHRYCSTRSKNLGVRAGR